MLAIGLRVTFLDVESCESYTRDALATAFVFRSARGTWSCDERMFCPTASRLLYQGSPPLYNFTSFTVFTHNITCVQVSGLRYIARAQKGWRRLAFALIAE